MVQDLVMYMILDEVYPDLSYFQSRVNVYMLKCMKPHPFSQVYIMQVKMNRLRIGCKCLQCEVNKTFICDKYMTLELKSHP